MVRTRAIPELERLTDIERQMAQLDIERVRLMAEAQRRGASWEVIGAALGTSRQSAWETYRERVRELLDTSASRVDAGEEELLESAAASLNRVRARRRRRDR